MKRKLYALLLAAVLLPAAHAQFIQQGSKLAGSGAAGSPSQGVSVAVSADGNTAIVGGDDDGAGAGAAWVFVRANGVWSQQGPKLAGTGGVNRAQGRSVGVSADGNTAIVSGNSFASVFVRANGVWSQQGPGLGATGGPVALSGDGNTAIIGGDAFVRANGVWGKQGTLQAGPVAIAADGNTAIVGNEDDNGSIGAAWVYTRTNGVWSQQGPKLVGSGAVGPPVMEGRSVGLSADGNTAVVGGPADNLTAAAGAVWVFTRTNGVWSQQGGKLVGTGAGTAGQGFSVSVSGDGNTVITGGPGDNQSLGAVWVFTRTNGVWSQQGSKLVGTGAVWTPGLSAPNQGYSVALSSDGHTLIEGGPYDQPMGSVWVFVSAPVHLAVSAPASVIAGNPFSFTVTALDINNSIVTGYTGTVHFYTTDAFGAVPADSMLINGVGTFTAILKSAIPSVPSSITVTDTANSLITGNSAPIAVQAAASSSFDFFATPTSAISGVPFNFSVATYDRFGNLAPSNTAHVRFTSSDGAAILPVESLLPGVAKFTAILKTLGNQTITVTDTGNSSITGITNPILVTGSSPSFNLARGKLATQSSILFGSATAGAASAVDGNTDGNYYDGSVTATNLEYNPWWQVDLGFSATINSIVVWNRTDCCGSRLNQYLVFVSDTPFLPTDTPFTLQLRAGTWSSFQADTPNPFTIIAAAGAQGRYVRVQLQTLLPTTPPFPGGALPAAPVLAGTTGPNYLSLAEVQVFGTPGSLFGSSLAQGKPATQSSTLPGYANAGAGGAVDGNPDGNFFNGSVTATNADPNAWWQVDLGASAAITSVAVYNRTDCCGSRLGDYWIFISDTPFLPTDTPATLQNRAGTFASHQSSAPNPSTTIAAVAQGRYVRVQLSGTDYLSLAEVLVFGTGGPGPTNVALGKSASQSSTLPGYATDGASVAVDGNRDGNFFDGSVTATNLDPNAWWQVDLGASVNVSSIAIWNRTDCCGPRLGDYWVFVSDTPFLATDTPATLQNRAGTFSSHQSSAPNSSTTITAAAKGRYVRVQLSGTDYLSLAEVQVFGQ